MDKDIKFLGEMQSITTELLYEKYDVTKLQYLDKMISDWKHELEQKLNIHVVSVKLTDEEIWQWIQWLDKRCAFTEHQQDYIFFAVRQILKKEAGFCSGEDKTT